MPCRAIVVGAGLAGLSAALSLAEAGMEVQVLDAAAGPGGRCRSYHDPRLGLTIDNGNHLVLSGNAAVNRFLARCGTVREDVLIGPAHADYAFADLQTGERWTVRIGDGRFPSWVFNPQHRVPGSRVRDYWPLARLLLTSNGTVGSQVPTDGAVWERMLEPILLAALNTTPAQGSARLVGRVLRETVARGGRAMRPRIAAPTLDAAFVDPACRALARHGGVLATGRRLRAISVAPDRVTALDWGAGAEIVQDDCMIVLAVPPWVASDLLPGLTAPVEHRAIVNAHFASPAPKGAPMMLGLLGGSAQWVFTYPDRISVTVSDAGAMIDADRQELARTFWSDICRAYAIDAPMPAWQVVKEKRATFAATPAQDASRPGSATRWRNLFLAGDWTDTGLPSTIEGAIRSGETAAHLAIAANLR